MSSHISSMKFTPLDQDDHLVRQMLKWEREPLPKRSINFPCLTRSSVPLNRKTSRAETSEATSLKAELKAPMHRFKEWERQPINSTVVDKGLMCVLAGNSSTLSVMGWIP